jgi:hypothetical protein
MSEAPKTRTPRIPPESRGVLFVITPWILAFGVWSMVTARIGRRPSPIEGTPAIVLGAVIAGFAVALFAIAWAERGSTDG